MWISIHQPSWQERITVLIWKRKTRFNEFLKIKPEALADMRIRDSASLAYSLHWKVKKKLGFFCAFLFESVQSILQNELDPSHLSLTQTAALSCLHPSKNHRVHIILWRHNGRTASQQHFPSFHLSASDRELSAWLGESDKDHFSRGDMPHLN